MVVTFDRWTYLIIIFIFLLVFGTIGWKKNSTDKDTVDNAVETEKLIESEPEKKHYGEYYKREKENEPDEGSWYSVINRNKNLSNHIFIILSLRSAAPGPSPGVKGVCRLLIRWHYGMAYGRRDRGGEVRHFNGIWRKDFNSWKFNQCYLKALTASVVKGINSYNS